MSVGKHWLLAWAGLGVVEAASWWLGNGLVTSTAWNIATSINWVVTGTASTTAPYLTGPLAPFATWAWSLWNWSEQYAERGVMGMTEKTALNYGVVGGLGTAAGLMAAPWVGTALTVWAGLWTGKHLLAAGKEFAEDPLGNIWSLASAPFKWVWSGLNSLRWRWAPATP